MTKRFLSKPFVYEKSKYCPEDQDDDVKYDIEIHIPLKIDNKRVLIIESPPTNISLPTRRIIVDGKWVASDMSYPESCEECGDTNCCGCEMLLPQPQDYSSQYELIKPEDLNKIWRLHYADQVAHIYIDNQKSLCYSRFLKGEWQLHNRTNEKFCKTCTKILNKAKKRRRK